MKTLIAILLLSLSQWAQAQTEKLEIPLQHPEIKFYSGTYSFAEFVKLPCTLQFEELLEVNEKYGHIDGSQSVVYGHLEQKRYVPESQSLMQEHLKIMEEARKSYWEERSHKYFLFKRFCHARKNSDRFEANPAELKKDYDKRMAN